MKTSLILPTALLIGSSGMLLQPKSKSFLEVSCVPSSIIESSAVSHLHFCQASKDFGRMSVLKSSGFAAEPEVLMNEQKATLKILDNSKSFSMQSGDFLLETKPESANSKTWLGVLKTPSLVASQNSSLDMSCKVEFVSDCEKL
jgi:hypothetical protein